MTAERFVLDASVSLEWFLPGGRNSAGYAADVLAGIESDQFAPVVPDLWHYEMASAPLSAKRHRRISATKLRSAASRLTALQPETLSIQLTASEWIDAGARYHLRCYDAVCFELQHHPAEMESHRKLLSSASRSTPLCRETARRMLLNVPMRSIS